MYKLCFHIQKGGVGKTTISTMLAFSLSRRGHKTILIDCDKQGNASSWVCNRPLDYDIADVLYETIPVSKALFNVDKNLFLLPVLAIDSKFKQWEDTNLVHTPRAFEFLLADIEKLGFEYAILDFPPEFSLLVESIISVTDEVINPLTPEYFSIDGIESFVKLLRNVEKASRHTVKNDKIIINMINESFSRHKIYRDKLHKLDYQIFEIPQDSKIAECQPFHMSLYEYAPTAKSIPSFEALTDTFLGKSNVSS
ncbi:hypothetical protein FACS1894172_17640 [Spirochaetia bacterium]|nr:hypothetical protein FACS1894164_11280 [Spirochaetia bacterium]GHU35614.1 hypothetical protein FACS1894172_17640 [Spirochaetia bacterium]